MINVCHTPFPETNIQQFDAMRPASAEPMINTSGAVPISHPIQIRPSLLGQQRKFTLYRAEFTRLQKAAKIFADDNDPEVQSIFKESCEKIASLEKEILDDLKVKRTRNNQALEKWNKLTEALLKTYREVITEGIKQIEADWTDCLDAYKIIDGLSVGASALLQSQKQTLDKWLKCIEESMSQNRAMNLKEIIEKLLQDEKSARCHLRDLTAQKIEYLKQGLDATSPLFAGVLTEQNPEDPTITPYPLMTALQEQKHLQVISTKQMKHLLAEADCRKQFFKQAQLLHSGFLSYTTNMTQLSQQLLTAKDKLAQCRATLEKEIFAQELPSASPDLLNEVQQKTELLSLSPTHAKNEPTPFRRETSPLLTSSDSMIVSPTHAKNETMSPRLETTPPQISPDSMIMSPTSPLFDEEKTPPPVSFVSSQIMLPTSPRGGRVIVLDTNTVPPPMSTINPEISWISTLLSSFKKHALPCVTRPKKISPTEYAMKVNSSIQPISSQQEEKQFIPMNGKNLLSDLKADPISIAIKNLSNSSRRAKKSSPIESAAMRVSSFIQAVYSQQKEGHFVSINGKDILSDAEVDAVNIAIKNFDSSSGPDLQKTILRFLRDGELRPAIIDTFFNSPPDLYVAKLRQSIFPTSHSVAELFSIPENLVISDWQSQNPKHKSISLGDKYAVLRLILLGSTLTLKNLNQYPFIQLCEKITAKWKAIISLSVSCSNPLEDYSESIDDCFAMQANLEQNANELKALVQELSQKVKETRQKALQGYPKAYL